MSQIRKDIPYNIGFSMPAEWAPHSATWTSWPFDEDIWYGKLNSVREEFTNLVKTIAKYEHVHLLVNNKETELDARERLGELSNISLHRVSLNDVWFRDNGPIFILKENKLSFVKWEFNAWGQKFKWELDSLAPYEVAKILNINFFNSPVVMEGGSLDNNGKGICLTTKQCLLSKMRNPKLSQSDIEKSLKEYLGIKKLLWLEDGLEGDHTDGHIDTIVRFVDEKTIVYSITEDKSDKNYHVMQRNYELLKTFTDLEGNSFKLIPLVLPKQRIEIESQRLPATYANFYIGNHFVVVPLYQDPHDELALNTLRPLFPGREVIGLSSRAIINGGGSFHCVTQQQPAGDIWR
ncbi:agmatine deiminase family protein [Fluviispira sanaruensis]|uniref:Agmatine deiminase family protein n=1 Tax=Fluviispira sanaruensis TaxID=2493639 RepID=A0A4P2VQC1_FLUSA|nr:agmatine deiminase family protein [Fluviispira sanaruensis]BBH54189.1 agmatine deiminase family protein [Fluviispira sanaruensis]